MPRVVVPAHAGVFSALGCLVAEVAYDHVQTFRRPLDGLTAAELDARFAPLVDGGVRPAPRRGPPGGGDRRAAERRRPVHRPELRARGGLGRRHRRAPRGLPRPPPPALRVRDRGRGGVREPPRARGCRGGGGAAAGVARRPGPASRSRSTRRTSPRRGPPPSRCTGARTSRPSIRSRARPSSRTPGRRPWSIRATPPSSTPPATSGWGQALTSEQFDVPAERRKCLAVKV